MAHVVPAITPAPAIPRIEPRQWLTLATVLGGTFVAFFDVFVVNVAIPTVQRDLHASFAQVQLVIAAYALAYAVALITGGRLGDIYGRKRLFMLGMAGFTLTSALCGVAPFPIFLIISRVVQGLSAALMTPQVVSIIQVTFPPRERGRALGIYGAVFGFAATAAQVLGGLLIHANLFGLSWRPAFLVNIPVGVGTLVVATFLLAESRSATAPRLDLGGVCLLTVGLFLLAFPLVEGREAGWPAWSWLCLLASIPVLAAFIAFERRETARSGSPLVVLRLFRHRAFVAGLVVAASVGAGAAGFLLALALYLQIGLRLSPFAAGLILGPGAVGYFLGATLAAKLIPRFGSRLAVCGLSLWVAAWIVSIVAVHRGQEAGPVVALALLLFAMGVGNGLTTPAVMTTVLADVERDDAGSASGIFVTAQQIGNTLGVASIGVIFFGVLAGRTVPVSTALAPSFGQQAAALGLPAETVAAMTTDFRACADDRARGHDPAIMPASCQRATLHPADPQSGALIATFLQGANARNYANADVIGSLAAAGIVLIAIVGAVCLPAPRRSAHA